MVVVQETFPHEMRDGPDGVGWGVEPREERQPCEIVARVVTCGSLLTAHFCPQAHH